MLKQVSKIEFIVTWIDVEELGFNMEAGLKRIFGKWNMESSLTQITRKNGVVKGSKCER